MDCITDLDRTLKEMRDLSLKIVAGCASQDEKRKLHNIINTMYEMQKSVFLKEQAT